MTCIDELLHCCYPSSPNFELGFFSGVWDPCGSTGVAKLDGFPIEVLDIALCDNYSTPKSRFTCFCLILHATFSFKIVWIFAEASEETMEASSSVLAVVWTETFSIFFETNICLVLTPGETQLRTATTRNERSCVQGWILWGREYFY